ncbi:MAG: deoxyribonuclease V [Thermodesulfobacteriota bacterium]|nr:deoxyribonuclease V [Thermodesulfobacteriota bacterium]
MKTRHLHPWNVSFHEAMEIQRALRPQLIFPVLSDKISIVAGADVSCSKKSNAIWAGVVVLSYPGLVKVEEKCAKGVTDFPYIPGLLSFREIPAILKAVDMLEIEPDLFFCDGQGIAHPRGLGLASHLGLLIEKPTIGCAKKHLVGEYSEVGQRRGQYSLLFHKGREIGAVLRTRTGVKPLFISSGYGLTTTDAIRMVLDCGGSYRTPEPIRMAHLLVNRRRRSEEVFQSVFGYSV